MRKPREKGGMVGQIRTTFSVRVGKRFFKIPYLKLFRRFRSSGGGGGGGERFHNKGGREKEWKRKSAELAKGMFQGSGGRRGRKWGRVKKRSDGSKKKKGPEKKTKHTPRSKRTERPGGRKEKAQKDYRKGKSFFRKGRKNSKRHGGQN